MTTRTHIETGLLRACQFAALLVLFAHVPAVPAGPAGAASSVENTQARISRARPPRQITITYTTHGGRRRHAYVLVPYGYDRTQRPPIPLVISPHGRAVTGKINVRRWGTLPTIGRFAVINPDGYGRVLPLHSWGYAGQIADLARMPEIVEHALPWLRIDRGRLYAIGASMGAQETLLLVGRYPRLLAGAVAVDGPADFALQYRNFVHLKCSKSFAANWGKIGPGKQRLARKEIGGTPTTVPERYSERSPITYAKTIAASSTRLQIWWSRADKIVLQPARQSGRMAALLRSLHAPVEEYVGRWEHTEAMRHETDLPKMLARLGLLPPSFEVERLSAVCVESG